MRDKTVQRITLYVVAFALLGVLASGGRSAELEESQVETFILEVESKPGGLRSALRDSRRQITRLQKALSREKRDRLGQDKDYARRVGALEQDLKRERTHTQALEAELGQARKDHARAIDQEKAGHTGLERRVAELEKELARSTDAIERSTRDLQKRGARIQELEGAEDQLGAVMREFEAVVRELDKAKRARTRTAIDYAKRVEGLEAELSELRKRTGGRDKPPLAYDRELIDLRKKLEAMTADIEKRDRLVAELRADIAEKKKRLRELEDAGKAVGRARRDLGAKERELASVRAEAGKTAAGDKARIGELTQAHAAEKEKTRELAREVAALRKAHGREVDAGEKERAARIREAQRASAAVTAANDRIKALAAQVAAADKQLDSLRDAAKMVEKAQAEVAAKERDLLAARAAAGQADAKHAGEVVQLVKAVDAERKKTAALEIVVADLEKARRRDRGAVERATKDLTRRLVKAEKALTVAADRAEEAAAASTKAAGRHAEEKTQLTGVLDQERANVKVLEIAVAELEETRRDERDAAAGSAQDLVRRAEKAEKALADAVGRADKAETKIVAVQKELREAGDVTKALKRAQAETAAKARDLADATQRVAELEKEIADTRKQLREAGDSAKAIKRAQAETAAKAKDLADATQRVAELEKEIAGAQKELRASKNAVRTVEKARADVVAKERQLASVQTAAMELARQHENELAQMDKLLKQERLQTRKLGDEVAALKKTQATVSGAQAAQRDKLEQRAVKAEKELLAAGRREQAFEARLKEQAAELAAREAAIRDLKEPQQQVAKLRSELKEARRDAKVKADELAARCRVADTALDRSREALRARDKEAAALKRRVTDLQARLKAAEDDYREAAARFTTAMSAGGSARSPVNARRRALTPDDPQVGLALNEVALMYKAQRRHADAEPLFKWATTVFELSLGRNHLAVSTTLSNLGDLYRDQGDHARAEPLYRRSLQILEDALGRENAQVADALNSLAFIHKSTGNVSAAEPLYERAIRIYEKIYGAEHPHVAAPINNLALLYLARKEYGRAEVLLQRALKILQARDQKDERIVNILRSLSELYQKTGDAKKAMQYRSRAKQAMYESMRGR